MHAPHKLQTNQTKNKLMQKWSKFLFFFGKHENLLSRINFIFFLCQKYLPRFMPQIPCLQRNNFLGESTELCVKNCLSCNPKFSIFFFPKFTRKQKSRNLLRQLRLSTHHFVRVPVVRRCAFLIIRAIPIRFLLQWLKGEWLQWENEKSEPVFRLPMARAEPVRCPMVRAYPMCGGCDVSHLMNYPISRRCSEMIVCPITMLLNSQMLTSCSTMKSSFAEESSWESCWGLSRDEILLALPTS